MNIKTLKPLRDLILVKKIELDLTTTSGIILLANFSDDELTKDLTKPHIAEVIAFGPGRKEGKVVITDMSSFEVGQKIIFGPTAFEKKFESEGDTYFLLEERHVFGIYK